MGSAARRPGAYGGEYLRAGLLLSARGGRRLGKRTSQTRAKEGATEETALRRLKTIFSVIRPCPVLSYIYDRALEYRFQKPYHPVQAKLPPWRPPWRSGARSIPANDGTEQPPVGQALGAWPSQHERCTPRPVPLAIDRIDRPGMRG
jgi:hypothetical protein